jgi:hypothetical protein
MLAKALGAEPVLFFGAANGEYPYLDYLPGIVFPLCEAGADKAIPHNYKKTAPFWGGLYVALFTLPRPLRRRLRAWL